MHSLKPLAVEDYAVQVLETVKWKVSLFSLIRIYCTFGCKMFCLCSDIMGAERGIRLPQN